MDPVHFPTPTTHWLLVSVAHGCDYMPTGRCDFLGHYFRDIELGYDMIRHRYGLQLNYTLISV
jgi:hypothetical protein